MKTEEVIARYDDVSRKGFDYHFIISELNALDEFERKHEKFKYELTAFMLVPGANNAWKGHYYGPMFTLTNESGKPYSNPSLSDVNELMVGYWESRSKEAINPLLKSQYLNLVIDFKKSITGIDVDDTMISDAIDNLILVATEGYASHAVVMGKNLTRAFNLANGNEQLLNNVKDALISFEQKYAHDDTSAGLWGIRFNLMLSHRSDFTKAEIKILVDEHENRLRRLMARNSNAKQEALDPFAVEQQVILLANFYSSANRLDDTKRVLGCFELAHKRCFDGKPATFQMGQLQRILQRYLAYGITTEKDRLAVEIQKVSGKAKSELIPQPIELKIPRKEIKNYLKFLLEGDHSLRLQKYVYHFTPKELQQKASVKEQAKKYPLVFMMNNQILDSKGRPSSIIGSIENDLEGHVVRQTSQVMQIEGFVLRMATEQLVKEGDLSIESIISEIQESPIFEADRIPIIKKALQMLFDNDHVVAAHLLVPQIEHALAVLVEESGGSILNVKQDGNGFTQKTLSELISDESVKTVLSSDAAFYMHVLFTDNRGWNVRNNIVTGISSANSFSYEMTDRLLHVLVMLSYIRKAK